MATDEEIQVAVRLARIEEKLDQLVETNRVRGEDHENRIRALERWRYAIPPTLVLASVTLFNQLFGR
ncbi:hypothetical protein [Streptomyces sp. NPDC002855]|uniref:hypothetical protein n=1 Tax=Streptomyces sp. NPDC002855 TaxID=3154437 RepID=UPI00333248C2